MEFAEIFLALAANKFDFAQYLRVVRFRGKASILILDVVGGDNDIFGNFVEIAIVAAAGAG